MRKAQTVEVANPLKQVIINELQTTGVPMSLARFMELGLMHPEHGYYSTKERIFNKGGDFTTSPEISQMFGEMLGLWIMSAIRNNYTPEAERDSPELPPLGRLNTVNLVELGPGSGLMMSDILRVISSLLSNYNTIFRH